MHGWNVEPASRKPGQALTDAGESAETGESITNELRMSLFPETMKDRGLVRRHLGRTVASSGYRLPLPLMSTSSRFHSASRPMISPHEMSMGLFELGDGFVRMGVESN